MNSDKSSTPQPHTKKRPGWIKWVIAIPVVLTLGAAIAGTGVYLWMKFFITSPADTAGKPVVFTVARGQGMGTIAKNLKARGLITDPLRFKLYARYKKAATLVKTGEYELSPALSPEKILAALISGKVKLYRITVPEGFRMDEIAELIEKMEFCSTEHFLNLCKDKTFIRRLDLPGITLEGYLYPDTYFFDRSTSCRRIIEKMTTTFKQVFTQEWKYRASELGFTVHDIVTLASIIEKETGDAGERPLIASVFHNRLKKKMRLESDPTVIYGVDDYHGRIRYRHLRRLTPYNTYKIKGLPLGPIANPGEKALEATLYPAKSNYLFFVSKNDTTHKFSTNLRDHNRAVKKYQLNR